MNARPVFQTIDEISYWSGKAFAWLIVALTFVVSIEVFKRYILNAPTAWIFDLNNMLYGTLFMMCGAYTLARPDTCAPTSSTFTCAREARRRSTSRCISCSLSRASWGSIYAGYGYAADSWRIAEHSTVTAEGPPIYYFKTVIPIAGALVMLQGLAEIVRCIVCLRTGAWPARLEDVEEIDVIDTQLAHSEYVDEESRRAAMEGRRRSTRRRATAASWKRAWCTSERSKRTSRRSHERSLPRPDMLGLIVVAIMMGFPTAFTLMGLGMIFGFIAFWAPAQHWYDNRVFDLIVQRTYGVMTNDTLLSIPLFVFMGYIMERAALVDRMFHSVQLAFRRVPASLAVTTLLVCAFWGIASGIVGAVVVLMGVIAMRPMLNAGYDVRLASGAITAGGTLGILIPPSVMLIVYAAVAGQSIVKLYAAAMLPGFFLTFLYLVYILGWAIINPKIAPKLPPDQYRLAVPDYLKRLERGRSQRVLGGLIAAAFRPSMVEGATAADGQARPLRPDREGCSFGCGAGGADRRHLRRDMVVCPHLQRPGGDDRGRFGSRRTAGGCSADGRQPSLESRKRWGHRSRCRRSSERRRRRSKSSEPQQSADAPPEEMSSS